MSFHLVVAVTAIDGEQEKVAEAYAWLEAESRREPAVLDWRVLRSLEDPRRFLLYEVYRDETGLYAHRQTEHFKRYQREILPLIAKREATRWRPLTGD